MPYLRDIYASSSAFNDPLLYKGDLLTRNNLTESDRLPVGADGTYLMADSTSNFGLSWQILDVGFATVNANFTQPSLNSTVSVQVSTNRWIQIGMYVYVESGGVYLVTAKSGSNLITLKNLYVSNTSSGTTIPIAKIITPAGQRGNDGANSYNIVSNSFTIPNVNFTFLANIANTSWVNVNQVVHIDTAGFFLVTAKSSSNLTLSNLNWESNATPGTSISSNKSITVAGIKGLDGLNGVNAYSLTTSSFIMPSVNNTTTIDLDQSAWLAEGQHIYIESAGSFIVTSNNPVIQIANDGSYNNTSAGTTIPSGLKVSPSGLTGPSGSNALVTQLAASFSQPIVNSTVSISVTTTSFLEVGSYIYIPVGGFYKVDSIVDNTTMVIKNLGTIDNVSAGTTIPSLGLIVPSGIPGLNGVNGTDGTDGTNGLNGINGQSIHHISLTSTVGLDITYTIWGDSAETINLGTFVVTNGESGTLTAAPAGYFNIQATDVLASSNQLVFFAKTDGFYFINPDEEIYKLARIVDIPTPPSIGNTIGDLVQLVNVNGIASLPAVDGSQLLNLPAGGHTIEVEASPFVQRTKLNFLGDLLVGSDDSINNRTIISVNSGLSNLGDLLYHNGTNLATLHKGSHGQVLTSDTLIGLTWTTPVSSGDMLKTTYDTNSDGIVNAAEAIAGSASNNQYYGTDNSGTKGFYNLPTAGTVTVKDNLTTLNNATTINFVSGAVVSINGTIADIAINEGVTLPTSTKGDLIVHNGTTNIALAVSTDDFTYLSPDSTSSSGLAWKPLAGNMLKSVYDTNNDGIVDAATAIAGTTSSNQYYGTNTDGVKGFYDLPTSTGHTIMDDGVVLSDRSNIDFIGSAFTVTDDPVNNKTVVLVTVPDTIDGGIKLNRVYTATLASLTI